MPTVIGELPKPNKTDDAEKASLATERWKALKKDTKTIAQSQVLRLELAMCGERRSVYLYRNDRKEQVALDGLSAMVVVSSRESE